MSHNHRTRPHSCSLSTRYTRLMDSLNLASLCCPRKHLELVWKNEYTRLTQMAMSSKTDKDVETNPLIQPEPVRACVRACVQMCVWMCTCVRALCGCVRADVRACRCVHADAARACVRAGREGSAGYGLATWEGVRKCACACGCVLADACESMQCLQTCPYGSVRACG